MKLLITGGSGFIGRNLSTDLGRRHQVTAPSRAQLNLLDEDEVRSFLLANQFDVVIHAATQRSNRKLGTSGDLLDHNCRMFFNLARNHGQFGKMLFLSSGAVYDRRHSMPLMPEDYFDAHVPADDYGFSKYVCAKHIDSLRNVYELRLFAVFGPHEDWQVRFISNACCRALWDLPVVIRQNVYFDFLDVADLARMLEWFLDHQPRERQYNVCSGRALDLETLAGKVIAASGKRLEAIVKNEGLGREYSGDNSRLMTELNGFRLTDIDESIAALYRWYVACKESIDPKLLHFDA